MVIRQHQRTSGEVLRWSAALLTAAAAAIHFAVTPEHFDEDWAFGVFFAAAAWAQLAWALLVVGSDDRRFLSAGIAGNVAIALVWVRPGPPACRSDRSRARARRWRSSTSSRPCTRFLPPRRSFSRSGSSHV